MPNEKTTFKYVIIGAGLAGASAVQTIREIDKNSPVLLIGSEPHLPYHRPPLSKGLWLGKKKLEDIFILKQSYFSENAITVMTGVAADSIDVRNKTVVCSDGTVFSYEKLLLATGGSPKTLSAGQAGICYYRYLDDYLSLRNDECLQIKKAVIIGGGFIGSEMAAALSQNSIAVTMIFPEQYPCSTVFPRNLGIAIKRRFEQAGIRILTEDIPVSFGLSGASPVTRTKKGQVLGSDCVIAGIGITPSLSLAKNAGLACANGIIVNSFLQTSDPDVYAAGDNALFPYPALDKNIRVEHWDNALAQGKLAARNMAGLCERYEYMPYFFSDLFEFGYEAVGDINASYDIYEDWQEEFQKGVIYYLQNGLVKGVLLFNVWEKTEEARRIIREKKPLGDGLARAIR